MIGPFSSVWFFVGFVAGLASAWAGCRVADIRHNRRTGEQRVTRMRTTWIAGALVLLFVAYSTASTYENGRTAQAAQRTATATAEAARDEAVRNSDCQRQFFEALTARTKINNEDTALGREYDRESRVQRDAVGLLIHELLIPPPEIAALEQDDPRYTVWVMRVLDQAYRVINASQETQRQIDARVAELDAERRNHPYPEPTCGR